MAENKIMAISIDELYYGEVITDASFDGKKLKALLASLKKVDNIHGDSFTYEEDEATVTTYKNQLTGQTYRQDKEEGEKSLNFTIGEYDFQTKADLQGGVATSTSWKRGTSKDDIYKALIAKTQDNVWIVFPKAAISGRGATTDNAIGLAVKGTAMEAGSLASEYWFDDSEVVVG